MTKRQIIPGVSIEPRISETAKGKVEFDLTGVMGPLSCRFTAVLAAQTRHA